MKTNDAQKTIVDPVPPAAVVPQPSATVQGTRPGCRCRRVPCARCGQRSGCWRARDVSRLPVLEGGAAATRLATRPGTGSLSSGGGRCHLQQRAHVSAGSGSGPGARVAARAHGRGRAPTLSHCQASGGASRGPNGAHRLARVRIPSPTEADPLVLPARLYGAAAGNRSHRYIGKVCCLLLVRAEYIGRAPGRGPEGTGNCSSCYADSELDSSSGSPAHVTFPKVVTPGPSLERPDLQ